MNIAIVGCQNGDEGKGKFTDYFTTKDSAVVRYQGGPHTGHTVETELGRFRFVQVPSGVARGAVCFVGNGCVIDPVALAQELRQLTEQTGAPVRLIVSRSAHVVFPYHRAMDAALEAWRGDALATSPETGFRDGSGQLGSTRRGVGPCREDKIARIGLRMIDLLDADLLKTRLARLIVLKRRVIESLGSGSAPGPEEDWDAARLAARYAEAGRELSVYLGDVAAEIVALHARGVPIVFEGAQSVALDVEHGTYPYCSSGNSSAGGLFVGTGLPPGFPVRVLGVMKAYATTVGGGPLPTELSGALANRIRERGREYGTVTGRARRVGWLDLCYVRRAVRLDGTAGLCISSLDVLGGLDSLQVCTHYESDGMKTFEYPVSMAALERLRPVYKTLRGWPEIDPEEAARGGISGLPKALTEYLDFIAGEVGVPVAAVGIGPARHHTLATGVPI